MPSPELMLLGGPNSGKTHFAGQLYGRLRRRPGQLRIRAERGTPSDLAALEEVLHCLESGHAAEHTAAGTWAEVLLPLIDDCGRTFDLRWPDYAGEQLHAVFRERAVTESWRLRLAASDGWLLLVRLHTETSYPDALAELTKRKDEHEPPKVQARVGAWDANARWVETLQLLLQVAGVGTSVRVRRPRLAVLLSCYDELDRGDDAPRNALAERLPLVSSFIDSVWTETDVSVWGLSALGHRLDKASSDERFIDDGPESQGWIVHPNGGPRDADLTKPVAWLVRAS